MEIFRKISELNSPHTKEVIAHIPQATREEVEQAIDVADTDEKTNGRAYCL